MAAKTIHRDEALAREEEDYPTSFEVTQVIGSVLIYDSGRDCSPYEAAFRVIGQHSAPGSFTFPLGGGGTCRVTVEHEMPTREDDPR